MVRNPLYPPRDDLLISSFLGIDLGLYPKDPDRALFRRVAENFGRIPYENLTKIIKEAEGGNPMESRRMPAEVLRDHIRYGTGGTCFSLTATLLHVIRTLGYEAEPVLADRRYGPNTHCALLVWIGGERFLLDPGYLLLNPVPVHDSGEMRIDTGFQQILLTRGPGSMDLCTVDRDRSTYRLTYRTEPAGADEFLKAWDDSFHWEMMEYPLLTRAFHGKHLYLRSNYLQVRGAGRVERKEIPGQQLAFRIASDFGISPEIALRAIEILKQKGGRVG
jgi:arylamine N-acetyltransferase